MFASSERAPSHPWLVKQNFFHGYLAREDLTTLLRRHEDFLVRYSEGGRQKPRDVLVSVLYDPENKVRKVGREAVMEAIQNIAMRSFVKEEQTLFFLDTNFKFPSVEELFTYHTQNPISLNKIEVTLRNAVCLEKWEYTPQAIQIGKLMRTGSFGEIRRGKLTTKDGPVIDVTIRTTKGRSEMSRQHIRELVRQARLLRYLNHPNVLRFYGVSLLELPILVFIETVSGEALDAYLLEKKSTVDLNERLRMMVCAGCGIEYLHIKDVLLRDIAAKNCIYTSNKVLKISEFGLSRRGCAYTIKSTRKGSSKLEAFAKWMAPESIRTFSFDRKSDAYTYGVLIYEIFACREPYAQISTSRAKEAIMAGDLNHFPPNTPYLVSEYVKEKLWNMEPDKRATAGDAAQWLEKFASGWI